MNRLDSVCDAGVLAFALFTLCAHAAVFLGLGLDGLIALAGAAALAGALGFGLILRRGGARRAPQVPAWDGEAPPDEPGPPFWLRAAVVASAGACGLAVAFDASLAGVWPFAFAGVAAAAGYELLVRVPPSAASESPSSVPFARREHVQPVTLALIAGLSLACLVLTLVSHRPDADDAFYLNLAVAAVDHPDAPLLAGDTLHGVPDVPLPLPVYRVHSLELLEAVLSRIAGSAVLDVAHLWLPALAALFVPLVLARVLRIVMPRSWPWALCIAFGVLLFTASASHGPAGFGLVRLHQGKALLLTLALPLTVACALELARGAGRGGSSVAWLRLAAVQIAAVGLSASGLWLAPAVALPALLAGLPDLRSDSARRRLLLGALASAYPLALALVLRGATADAFRDAAVPSPEATVPGLELARRALRAVLGAGVPGAVALFVALAAWAFARAREARRLCAFSALAALVLWNPFAATWIAAHLTSAPTYWRVLWLLPLPILAAVVLAAPIEHAPAAGAPGSQERTRRRRRIALSMTVAAALFAASTWLVPRSLAVSPANHVRLAAPGWKIPPAELDAALAIAAIAGPEEQVLAPRRVAPWLVTLHRHPTPLVVRAEYLPVLHGALGKDELERRMRLLRLVSGQRRPPQAEALLRDALADARLRVVCLSAEAGRWPDLAQVLRESGFQKIHANADYEVWRRL